MKNPAVIKAPLEEGESIPNMAIKIVHMRQPAIWTPVPVRATNKWRCRGGRKTSPWTSFQPVSSMASSSSSSSLLYWAMGAGGFRQTPHPHPSIGIPRKLKGYMPKPPISLLKVRTIIIVKIPAKNKTTTIEFIIENQ